MAGKWQKLLKIRSANFQKSSQWQNTLVFIFVTSDIFAFLYQSSLF